MINWFKKRFGPPRTYFCSDFHFSHRNVIDYCNRPFGSLQQMNEHMVKVWNQTVRPQDTIYVLGDFSLNKNRSRDFVPKLNGIKILIAGNHDECHISRSKHSVMQEKYLEHGWSAVYPHNAFITLSNGMNVQLCHLPYPPNGEQSFDDRYLNLRPKPETEYLLHGHHHGVYIKNDKSIDVGWDAHNGKILSEQDVIDLINDPRTWIPSHLTETFTTRQKTENM